MSESESEDAGDAAFRWDPEKKCLVTVKKEEQETPAENAEASSEDEEATAEENLAGDVCLDMASTPELLLKAKAVGEPMLSQLANKWVVDEATGLSFLLSVDENRIYCWNDDLQYLYEWKGRGKLEFLQVGFPQANLASATASSSTASAPIENNAERPALFVTVIPPHILRVEASIVERRLELSKNLDRVEADCPDIRQKIIAQTRVTIRMSKEENALVMKGTATAAAEAMSLWDQAFMKVHGVAKADKLRKAREELHIEWLKHQTVEEAAQNAIPGMGPWAQRWELPSSSVRRLKKCDAQLQRFVIRHFSPQRAKPKNALQAFVERLQRPPQSWRLEAVVRDGHIDTECDTFVVDDEGKVAGSAGCIQLEAGDPKIFGDVDEEHVRLFPVGKDWYAMALEAKIGAIVDGVKLRKADGPHALKDGSVVTVGKYLLLCEIGDPKTLQQRRLDLLGATTTMAPGDFEDVALRLDDQDRRAEEAERAEDAARADEFGDAFTELERQTSTVQADITSSTKRPQWEESEDEEDDDGDERDDEVRTKKSRLEGTTETLQRAETEDS
eukprot:GEMP01044250.1.p1 GENE.GEMP01044250.1~~GEMP01044250.1.p1  ORF type:complete len:589 (+),score=191.33 GEMP01044250.1:88-1767(+)